EGDDDGHRERGVEPDLGVDAGDDGERDGLGNQRQGDDEAGEYVASDVGKPVFTDGLQIHGSSSGGPANGQGSSASGRVKRAPSQRDAARRGYLPNYFGVGGSRAGERVTTDCSGRTVCGGRAA